MRRLLRCGYLLVWVILGGPAVGHAAGAGHAAAPPWSAPIFTGRGFTVPGVDNVPDLHGDINRPQLVVFFAGNQYMVVNDLIKAFGKGRHRSTRVFAETLPPGILARQIKAGALVIGNMRITLAPDVYTAGRGRIRRLQARRHLFGETVDYARNRLAIMTYRGNPDKIAGLRDLARGHLHLCMPNPRWEGIARNAIIPALRSLGGSALVKRIYAAKRDRGETYLTRVHHRETPLRIMARRCDAGVVWYTEAYFHARLAGHPTALVTIPNEHNHLVTYTAAALRSAPHAKLAAQFLRFLRGPVAQRIYRHYGFLPPPPTNR